MTAMKGAWTEPPAGGITHPSSRVPPRGLIKAGGDFNQRHTPGAGTSPGQRSVDSPLYFSIPDGLELDTDVEMAGRCLAAASQSRGRSLGSLRLWMPVKCQGRRMFQ